MKISIIIPTRNAEKYVEKLINKLKNQTIQLFEIIIIDTNSKDGTRDICNKHDKVRFIHINDGEFSHGGTRNQAASEAGGDILIFMTQDAEPEDCYFIEELIKPLGKNNVVGVYGRQVPREEASALEVFSRGFNYGDNDVIKSKEDVEALGVKTFFFSNVCSAFIRKEFWKAGGFPDNTIMNEDMIIASKFIFSGQKTCYASNARVIHSHSYTYMQQFKRNFDVGVVFVDSGHYFEGVKSESEGIKFVKEAIKFLVKQQKAYLIPHLIIDSGFKFIGYKLGYNYKKIPMKFVKKMSMHSFYFDKKEETEKEGAIG